jgi:hypothetical protein
MSSVVVIIANIFEAEPYQMSLVQRDDVIQHLTAYAPHPSFRDSVLPRTAKARPDSFDPARFEKAAHLGAEFAVTIKNDIAVWGLEAGMPLGAAAKSNRSSDARWR